MKTKQQRDWPRWILIGLATAAGFFTVREYKATHQCADNPPVIDSPSWKCPHGCNAPREVCNE